MGWGNKEQIASQGKGKHPNVKRTTTFLERTEKKTHFAHAFFGSDERFQIIVFSAQWFSSATCFRCGTRLCGWVGLCP